jgi:hypothetical protein
MPSDDETLGVGQRAESRPPNRTLPRREPQFNISNINIEISSLCLFIVDFLM